MEISNFIFNGVSLADIDMIPGSINTDSQSMTPATLNFTVTTTPTSRTKRFVSSHYDDTISFEIGIVKDPCASHDPKIDIETDRFIRRWLIREDGFKVMRFECEDYEDILVNCYLNVAPIYLYGALIGYTITGSTDSPYVYVEDYKKEFSLSAEGTVEIPATSDEIGFLYPKIEITSKSNSEYILGFPEYTEKEETTVFQVGHTDTYQAEYDPTAGKVISYIVKMSFYENTITVPGKVLSIKSFDYSNFLPLNQITFTYDSATDTTTIHSHAYIWNGSIPEEDAPTTYNMTYVKLSADDSLAKVIIPVNQTCFMDCDKSIITGINSPNDFNWIFPRMQQDWNHSNQLFYCNQACDVKITYTPRRKVVL